MENSSRERIRQILSALPAQTANLSRNPGYCLIQAEDSWLETPVYGLRQRNGHPLELSLKTGSLRKHPSWDRHHVRTEHCHYTSVNWTRLLIALLHSLSSQNGIFTTDDI